MKVGEHVRPNKISVAKNSPSDMYLIMEDSALKILLVEDNPGDARLLREMLSDVDTSKQFDLTHVERLSDGLQCLSEQSFDVVLLDMLLPDSSGLDTVESVQAQTPDVPIIVLTGVFEDEKPALEALKAGAQDYLFKDQIDGYLLVRSIRYAIERKRVQEAVRSSEEFVRNIVEGSFDMIIAIDENREIIVSNNGADTPFGYDLREVLGKPIKIFYTKPQEVENPNNTTLERGRSGF